MWQVKSSGHSPNAGVLMPRTAAAWGGGHRAKDRSSALMSEETTSFQPPAGVNQAPAKSQALEITGRARIRKRNFWKDAGEVGDSTSEKWLLSPQWGGRGSDHLPVSLSACRNSKAELIPRCLSTPASDLGQEAQSASGQLDPPRFGVSRAVTHGLLISCRSTFRNYPATYGLWAGINFIHLCLTADGALSFLLSWKYQFRPVSGTSRVGGMV